MVALRAPRIRRRRAARASIGVSAAGRIDRRSRLRIHRSDARAIFSPDAAIVRGDRALSKLRRAESTRSASPISSTRSASARGPRPPASRVSDRSAHSPRSHGLSAAVFCLSRIHDPASRSATLVMASMLSRWALVPIGYGLRPLERWGLGVPYEGPIRFREFSVSSAVALASPWVFMKTSGSS